MEMEIPKTLEEAIEVLKELKGENGESIPPSAINTRYLRNEWGLWRGSELAQWFFTKQIYHADDMSGIIVDSFERVINGNPIELDEQIKKYHKHWQKAYGDNHLKFMRDQVMEHIVKMRDEKIDKITKSNG